MAFSLWTTPFVGAVTAISADFLNKMRTEMARAIDGAGGTYTPTSLLRILGAGAGLEFGGDDKVTLSPLLGTHVTTDAFFTGDVDIDSADQVKMSGTNRVTYVSRPIVRQQRLELGQTAASSDWTRAGGASGIVPHWTTSAPNNAQYLWVPLSVPFNNTLTSVRVSFKPAAGHGSVPTTPAEFDVIASSYGTTTPGSSIANAVFSGSVAAYNAGFSLTATPSALYSLTSARLWVRIRNESLTNGLAGLVVDGVETTCTVTSQDEHTV